MNERIEYVSGGRVYHKRGLEPRRRVTVPVDGRLGLEHDDVIIELYYTDKLNIADIARLYGKTHGAICQRISRYRATQGTEDGERFTARRQMYGKVLRLLEETELGYREIVEQTGAPFATVRRVALRNGLGRK